LFPLNRFNNKSRPCLIIVTDNLITAVKELREPEVQHSLVKESQFSCVKTHNPLLHSSSHISRWKRGEKRILTWLRSVRILKFTNRIHDLSERMDLRAMPWRSPCLYQSAVAPNSISGCC